MFVVATCMALAPTCVFWQLQALPVEGSCCSEGHHRFHPCWLEYRAARKNVICVNTKEYSLNNKSTFSLLFVSKYSHGLWLAIYLCQLTQTEILCLYDVPELLAEVPKQWPPAVQRADPPTCALFETEPEQLKMKIQSKTCYTISVTLQ